EAADPTPAEPAPARPASRKPVSPFPVMPQTPPYLVEGKGAGGGAGAGAPLWEPSSLSEKQWDGYETPSFIRRTKHSSVRKSPHDIS
ncbi:MAG: hypothetical protein H6P96_804, partial [Candidatus Aminicenantes bacterium]|nr:hypothetical protein [Candidatus Aminicenantes bacterium]